MGLDSCPLCAILAQDVTRASLTEILLVGFLTGLSAGRLESLGSRPVQENLCASHVVKLRQLNEFGMEYARAHLDPKTWDAIRQVVEKNDVMNLSLPPFDPLKEEPKP